MSDQKPEILSLSAKPLPREVKVSTCGKAIIVGEHAVVYGSHAVAMPLKQMRMEIELRPLVRPESTTPEFHLKLGGKEVSTRVSDVIPEAFQILKKPYFSLQAKGHSSLPIGAGLGSSASLCIAIVKALADSMQIELRPQELADFGNRLEARFHGKPSGLDTSVVAFEECVFFAKNKEIETVTLVAPTATHQHSWHFALIDSRIRASTMSMIRIAEPYFSGSEGQQRIKVFDDIAYAVKFGLPQFDYQGVAEAMNACHALLVESGVVPPAVQDMIDECRTLGVPSAKITGAGGGGTILCLLDHEHVDEQIRKLGEHFPDHPIYRTSI